MISTHDEAGAQLRIPLGEQAKCEGHQFWKVNHRKGVSRPETFFALTW